MPETNGGFRDDTKEFVGYAKACLEGNQRNMDEIKGDLKEIKQSVSKLKLRVAAIGGTVSLIVSLVMFLLKSVFMP